MSDASQGPGWWLASDGKWYPPESAPAPPPPPPPPPAAPQVQTEPVTAKGVTGTVSFDGRILVIKHGGLGRLTAGKGEKRIPVSAITGVEWKPAGMAVRGFIRFTVPGGRERTSRFGQRTQTAARDENSVVFGVTQKAEFERLRDAVEAVIAGR
jgi:hypothetical protein